jgi:hypothetical protein
MISGESQLPVYNFQNEEDRKEVTIEVKSPRQIATKERKAESRGDSKN